MNIKDIPFYINKHYDDFVEIIEQFNRYEELLKDQNDRIIRLVRELHKSNKTNNTYYNTLKNIYIICSNNSCTANPEYLSDLLYDIERNVVDALSDSPKTCKTKD